MAHSTEHSGHWHRSDSSATLPIHDGCQDRYAHHKLNGEVLSWSVPLCRRLPSCSSLLYREWCQQEDHVQCRWETLTVLHETSTWWQPLEVEGFHVTQFLFDQDLPEATSLHLLLTSAWCHLLMEDFHNSVTLEVFSPPFPSRYNLSTRDHTLWRFQTPFLRWCHREQLGCSWMCR